MAPSSNARAPRLLLHSSPRSSTLSLFLLILSGPCLQGLNSMSATSFQSPSVHRHHHSTKAEEFLQQAFRAVSISSRPCPTHTTASLGCKHALAATAANTAAAAAAAAAGRDKDGATEPPSLASSATTKTLHVGDVDAAGATLQNGISGVVSTIGTTSMSAAQQQQTKQPPSKVERATVVDDSRHIDRTDSSIGKVDVLTQPAGPAPTVTRRQRAETASTSPSPCVAPRSLDSVRSSLIRQEETIIFSLIEREQFRQNPTIYADRTFRLHKEGVEDIYGRDASFLEYMLCETEKLHARVRRYMNFEELAFFPMFLPQPILPPLNDTQLLAPNSVNLNHEILRRYVSEVVPAICEAGDDGQHGSSIVCDVSALQAISRRVHLGKFVAESKFQADSQTYQELCRAGDAAGVNELLTNKAVEKKVLHRAFMKASTYGRDIGDLAGGEEVSPHFKVEPEVIMDLYRKLVIPLTKDVEIMYLFERAGYECPSLEGLHGDL